MPFGLLPPDIPLHKLSTQPWQIWTPAAFPSASQVAAGGKEPTCQSMQETWGSWVRSLGGEDPQEEDMATHSSFLAWEAPQTEGPGGLQSVGSQESGTTGEQALAHQPIKGAL